MDSIKVAEAFLTLLLATNFLLGSPGPATLSLAATGATVGFRRGYPFLAGILAGLAVVIAAAAVGLASLLTAFSELRMAAQIVAAGYIVYLAAKIATSPILVENGNAIQSAPRFRDGFILNLLNVKAYAVFLAVFSGFLLPFESTLVAYLATALVCVAVATAVDIIWLWFGGAIRPLFARPRAARILRLFFAFLMVLSVAVILID